VPLEPVTAGYFGVLPGLAPTVRLDDRYLGSPLLSLDGGLVAFVPGPAWTTSSLEVDLLKVGVPEREVRAATAWLDEASHRGDVSFPNVYRDPSVVHDFLDRFAPESRVLVVGAALDADEVDDLLAEQDREIGQDDGIVEMLRRAEPLAPGYHSLGYEPMEVTWGGFGSSWTTNALQPAVEVATGVVPNGAGFISTSEQARAVMAYLLRPEVPKEPGIWRAWQVVSYPRRTAPGAGRRAT
jgi:hypothetical protein